MSILPIRRIVREVFDRFSDPDVPVTKLLPPQGSNELSCMVAPLMNSSMWLVYMLGTQFSKEFRSLTVVPSSFSRTPWDRNDTGYCEYLSLRTFNSYPNNNGVRVEAFRLSVNIDPRIDTSNMVSKLTNVLNQRLHLAGHINSTYSPVIKGIPCNEELVLV